MTPKRGEGKVLRSEIRLMGAPLEQGLSSKRTLMLQSNIKRKRSRGEFEQASHQSLGSMEELKSPKAEPDSSKRFKLEVSSEECLSSQLDDSINEQSYDPMQGSMIAAKLELI